MVQVLKESLIGALSSPEASRGGTQKDSWEASSNLHPQVGKERSDNLSMQPPLQVPSTSGPTLVVLFFPMPPHFLFTLNPTSKLFILLISARFSNGFYNYWEEQVIFNLSKMASLF